MYFLEWVGIIAWNRGGPLAPPKSKADQIFTIYSAHTVDTAMLATWLSIVLLGRVLFVIGIRESLRRSGADTVLADFAVAAMAVSVILEVGSYGLAAAGAPAAATGDKAVVVGLNAAGGWLNTLLTGPLALSMVAASGAQLRSRFFPGWIPWVGLAAGALGVVAALVAGPGVMLATQGDFRLVPVVMVTSGFAVLGFWLWMLASAILLWLKTSRRESAESAGDSGG